jgi:tetratricopeptide (TPR) repeat protein
MYAFYDLRHHYDDLERSHLALLNAADAKGHSGARAQALFGLFEARYASGRDGWDDALDSATDAAWRAGLGGMALRLEIKRAMVERHRGQEAAAHRRAMAVLRVCDQSADPLLAALALQTAAITAGEALSRADVMHMLRAARRIYRRMNCTSAECLAMYRIGSLSRQWGRRREARAYLKRALSTAASLCRPQAAATIGVALGELLADCGEYAAAESALLRSRQEFERLGRSLGQASADVALAKLYLQTDRSREAQPGLVRAWQAARRLGNATIIDQIDALARSDPRIFSSKSSSGDAAPILL